MSDATCRIIAWHSISADILDFNRKTVLLIVDYFSKYPEDSA